MKAGENALNVSSKMGIWGEYLVHRILANSDRGMQLAKMTVECFLMAGTAHFPPLTSQACVVLPNGILFTLAGGHESPQGRRKEEKEGRKEGSKGKGEREGSHQKLPTNRDLLLSSSNY